jgi:hypothetical protein
METRTLLAASFLVAFALIAAMTWTMHREHYKSRTLQLLAGRVDALEKIVTGDHSL